MHVKRRNDVDNNGERKCNSYHFLYFPSDFLQMQFHREEVAAQCNPSAALNAANMQHTATDDMYPTMNAALLSLAYLPRSFIV